jgi:hypothetical protein
MSLTIERALLVICCLITQPVRTAEKIQVYFSPDGGCTEAVVKNLNSARTSICVQAYSFTGLACSLQSELLHGPTREA